MIIFLAMYLALAYVVVCLTIILLEKLDHTPMDAFALTPMILGDWRRMWERILSMLREGGDAKP